jgi:hypothetical protein
MSQTNLQFGELQFQVQKRHPGCDVDILQSYINERYRRLVRRIPWQRLKIQSVIPTVAEYTTGTVAVTLGSENIVGTDTVWTPAMDGRCIRFGSDAEYYEFHYASATTGTLDRDYENASDAAATYSLWQNIFPLPADCRELLTIRVTDVARDLDQVSPERLDEMAATRTSTGNPTMYALHMDDESSPPRQQVEVYPVPIEVTALPFWYIQDPAMFEISETSSYLPTWINPNVIYDGVAADVCAREKDYTGAALFEQKYLLGQNEMLATECQRIPAVQLQMADRFTRHRDRRGIARTFPFELP